MSFLQPWALLALPLLALPLLIHLIHRRRHSTVLWGAMMFLLEAARTSRGWQRLRHFLILLSRVAVVAALVFAVSRPTIGGWLGLQLGGPADCSIVIVDRSPSMGSEGAHGTTKLAAGLQRLVETLEATAASRWVVVDSATELLYEVESPSDILDLPLRQVTAASADLPSLLQRAIDYQDDNQLGRTEIWILSDQQAHDWRVEDGKWRAIRQQLTAAQATRTLLLSFPSRVANNTSVVVRRVHPRRGSDPSTLAVDLEIVRTSGERSETIGLEWSIGGARSVAEIEAGPGTTVVRGHEISVDGTAVERGAHGDAMAGWGVVSLPDDGNAADNRYYFAYGDEPERRTVVVAEDPSVRDALTRVAAAARDPELNYEVESLAPTQAATVDLQRCALLLWQGQLPRSPVLADIERFVETGGCVVFFPPVSGGVASSVASSDATTRAFGLEWARWRAISDLAEQRVETWTHEEGLVGRTEDGRALPLGELEIRRICGVKSTVVTPVARLTTGDLLLGRLAPSTGRVHICTTLPNVAASNLLENGVVLYAMVHRALEGAVDRLRDFRQATAPSPVEPSQSVWLSEHPDDVLSIERHAHAGVVAYPGAGENKRIAINRDGQEDSSPIVSGERIRELFGEADFVLVADDVDESDSLVEEVWRLLLIAMLVALSTEAVLCLADVGGGGRRP